MTQELWTKVDHYFEQTFLTDPVLDAVLAANTQAGLPAIDVSPAQGRFLELIARIAGARNVLEIGTLGGYSTICFARAVGEGGRVVTLEADPHHAAVARANLERSGMSGRVEVRVGPALQTLPLLEPMAPFDLVFIDADKPNNPNYLQWALRLARVGAVIICDNVVRHGKVADPESSEPGVLGSRRFFEMVAAEPRLAATALQTVGVKGYDGFALALVQA
jgi:predicted O-methyltransferase YrrM